MLTINNTLDGYLKDVEIKGNTIQDAENLADIRSVGDKVEGQELYEIPVLSCGKNLWNYILEDAAVSSVDGSITPSTSSFSSQYIPIQFANFTISGLNKIAKSFIAFYDKDKNYISRTGGSNYNNIYIKDIPANAYYFVLTQYGFSSETERNDVKNSIKIQLEEGTQATPYEPYIEDKLTILSPVQLEKVGDVADRIIEKDGVWGVEKNVKTVIVDGNNGTFKLLSKNATNTDFYMWAYITDILPASPIICDLLPNKSVWSTDTEGIYIHNEVNNSDNVRFRLNKSRGVNYSISGIIEYFKTNPMAIKYPTLTPQFIPLPHDQQVKLRTFANKTNISFLTEIEGTIKAQVPKSLGATVNTHTEQIRSLNNELTRVKKLEESTVSTVETESDFTTVEATTNGYFEDVKLEGKTLVNLADETKTHFNGRNIIVVNYKSNMLKPNTVYTVYLIDQKSVLSTNAFYSSANMKTVTDVDITKPIKLVTLDTIDTNIKGFYYYLKDEFVGDSTKVPSNLRIVFLEGDHTQTPPSYFEGLKSAGQDVEEVSVESVDGDGNLLNSKYKEEYLTTRVTADISSGEYVWLGKGEYCVSQMAKGFVGERYVYALYDEAGNRTMSSVVRTTQDEQLISAKLTISNSGLYKIVPSPHNGTSNTIWCKQFMINKGTTPKPYTPYQSDKKRLLYYNEETQTWEKPILRQWDSIEKHADGKYYYHQRSGEVVLNGSENWMNWVTWGNDIAKFKLPYTGNMMMVKDAYTRTTALCNNFNAYASNEIGTSSSVPCNIEGFGLGYSPYKEFLICIAKTKLVTQDIAGFKTWLNANPTTIVFQLAEEKVYECTNIDLITYANETNYIVECGAITPKTTLKVHNNISNVVSLLQKKVSLLESNITSYMITQNRLQLASTYSADSVTFKVDYFAEKSVNSYDDDLFNLILNNIIVGKENYDYDKMFNIIMDYASWSQISWDQFDILVGMMDLQHNPPIEVPSETPEA